MGEELTQATSTEVIFNVIDEDTLPPQFLPCQSTGDGSCVPPLYTAEVEPSSTGVSRINTF